MSSLIVFTKVLSTAPLSFSRIYRVAANACCVINVKSTFIKKVSDQIFININSKMQAFFLLSRYPHKIYIDLCYSFKNTFFSYMVSLLSIIFLRKLSKILNQLN